MKPAFLLPFLLFAVSCASSPEPSGGRPPVTAEQAGSSFPAVDIAGKPVRVIWRGLDSRTPQNVIGIVNHTSPEAPNLYTDPSLKAFKPIDDEIMAALLGSLQKDLDFFDLAEKGRSAMDYSPGTGRGVVSVSIGDESWALWLPRGRVDDARATSYVDSKKAVLYIYNTTLHFSATQTDDPGRVFRVPPPTRRPR